MVKIRPGVMSLPVFHKDQSLFPFCFLFVTMIYLMRFSVTQNCFQMIPHYLQQCIILKKATNDLNNDLTKITKWAFQWKMSFNPDISKQAHEVIFSRKRSVSSHPPLTFNNIPVARTNSQKHLGMQLDKKLNFEEQLKKVESNVNKTIGIIRKLQNVLPRSALLTIYKSFIRPHLDYGDIIYDKAFNESFHAKLESLQYNATLAITGAIKGSSTEKIYEELGLESLKSRRWYRKMSFCIKFSKVNHRHTYSTLYQIVIIGNIKQKIQGTFPLSLLNMIILRILFSFLQ